MMAIAGKAAGYIQPRYLMAGAMLAIAVSMYHFASLAPDASFGWFATARVYQMAGIPILFLTVTSFSYVDLAPEKSSQASALINVARNLGGSIGVSMAQTLLARREQFHQERLSENITASALHYRDTLIEASNYFAAHGASVPDAQRQAIGWVGQTLTDQTAYLSYVDVFVALAVLGVFLTPLALLLRNVDLTRASATA